MYEIIFNDTTNYEDMHLSYQLNLLVDRKRKSFKSKINLIDTTKLSLEDEKLLEFDFIQYSNFEIIALFKILFYKVNEHNILSINGKSITYFEKGTTEIIEKCYSYITNFISNDLKDRKKMDSKIVNSVLFKSKEYYPSLKEKFINKLETEKQAIAILKL